MAEVNTTENLRLWLRSCPAISKMDRFGVDFIGENPVEYALYSSPSTMNYGTDILGNVFLKPVQELDYIFAALFHFSKDIPQNLRNLEFFTDVINWIYKQNVLKSFPEIEEGKILSIMPTLSPYVFDADSDSGRYQIQLKIRYRRKPERTETNG